MESRNVIINNPAFAKQVLGSLSYYTIINGYKNTFLSVPRSEKFSEGTTFEDLYTLHIIDTNLNSIILKYVLFLERYLKTRLSYLVSKEYGVYTDTNDITNTNPSDYLFRDNYNGAGRNNILKKIKEVLTSPNLNLSVVHYANDKNHIPAWILVTAIPLGLTIKWYTILKPLDKQAICEQFIESNSLSVEEKKEFIIKSFNLLREFRNNIAHGNRTFNMSNLPVLPKNALLSLSYGSISTTEYNAGYGKSDTFAVILICFILLNDRYLLTNFLQDLKYTLMPYKDTIINDKTIFEIFRLPNNIFERLNAMSSKRFP
ncbi:MAG: Abi family protein [Lachnospiraceae bacterium]|nr:Abi family protein [Lachnospiraceae bacterium]